MNHKHTPPRYNKFLIFCITFFFLAFVCTFAYHTKYLKSQLIDFGIVDKYHTDNRSTISSWKSCLEQLSCDADVAFFGDSLTRRCDFQSYFPSKKIVNLGVSGDTIIDMVNRVNMLEAVHPEKVFIMAGINSLKNHKQINKYVSQYTTLCEGIINIVPDSELFIISVLPVSSNFDHRFLSDIRGLSNSFIKDFNSRINDYAVKNNLTYIDLYSLYEIDGALNSNLSEDGIHIIESAYQIWIDAISDYVLE